ncbi:Permease of the major facilitator superfamily protein [Paenibacillus terrae HPL-003]|uniref:Permease of the major facilitator superfamily protein n=1 Tax=Paenibacillus terrae (strain HPL-003) TaxID=985665 RepID=G7W1G3_PAETH|nr:MFS transporter [Paenibacillus terrae]AET57344.1 Permease of the major facilitator superfamily protein [Paenibacillus terrae HPL-003]
MHKRSFTYLLGTQTMSNAADILYIMALVSLVFHETDSIFSSVLVPLLRMGAQMISGFLAPLILARFQLPFILFVSQFGQLAFFALLLGHLWSAGTNPVWVLVFTLVAAMSFLDGWTTPARNALIPRLASGEGLMRANSLVSVSDQTVQLAGWGLSGVLVAVMGSEKTLLVACGLYMVALIFTGLIRDPLEGKAHYLLQPGTRVRSGDVLTSTLTAQHEDTLYGSESESPALPPKRKKEILREGWSLIGASRRLKALIFMDMIDLLGGSVWVGAFTLAFAQQVLHKSEAWWGYINAAYFAGAIGGGIIVLACVKYLQRRLLPAMLAGMACYGLLTAWYALNTLPPLTLLIVLLMGLPTEMSVVSRRTMMQMSVSVHDLPKVLSAQATLTSMTFCISLLLMGWIADHLGIVNLYLFSALLTLVAVIYGIFSRRALSMSLTASVAPSSE